MGIGIFFLCGYYIDNTPVVNKPMLLINEKTLNDIFTKPYGNMRYKDAIEGTILPGNPYYNYVNWELFYYKNPEQANNREYMVSLNPTQGGKKRRTKRSKVPTSKRTRAKKCTKKAGKKTKRTAKKMRS